jgi:hypothetical protein
MEVRQSIRAVREIQRRQIHPGSGAVVYRDLKRQPILSFVFSMHLDGVRAPDPGIVIFGKANRRSITAIHVWNPGSRRRAAKDTRNTHRLCDLACGVGLTSLLFLYDNNHRMSENCQVKTVF